MDGARDGKDQGQKVTPQARARIAGTFSGRRLRRPQPEPLPKPAGARQQVKGSLPGAPPPSRCSGRSRPCQHQNPIPGLKAGVMERNGLRRTRRPLLSLFAWAHQLVSAAPHRPAKGWAHRLVEMSRCPARVGDSVARDFL